MPLSFLDESGGCAPRDSSGGLQDRRIPLRTFRDLEVVAKCIYIVNIGFSWSAAKRVSNLDRHGLDFVHAERVFAGLTFTFEDDRFDHGEQRFVTLGLLDGMPVSLVHTETSHEIRVISFRKATTREARICFDQSGA